MDSVYNNTFIPLNAGALWQGRAEVVNKYNVACVSCASDTDGLLSLLQSQNDINYDFAGLYNITGGTPFNINDRIKAKNYRVMFENTSNTNQTYLRITTTYKDDIRDNLDIRSLDSDKDTLSIPALNNCITDGKINVNVEGITVSGVVVDISGQVVDIEGQTVKSQIYDYNNYAITSQLVGSKRGLDVNNIGTVRAYEGTTIKEIGAFTDSHNKVNLQTYDDALNDKINSCDIIGEDTGAIKVYVSNSNNNKVNCNVDGQTLYSRLRDANNNDITSTTGYLNTFENNNITGFSLEDTQLEIKAKTDNLTFNDNDGVLELNVFDVQNNLMLDSIKTNTGRLNNDSTYDQAIQVAVKNTVDVSGSVNVNTISGYALESGGNLATVATNTNRLKSDTTYTDAIQVAIKNATVDVSGSVHVNTISGYALETGGNLATVATNTNKLKSDTTFTDAIQVAVKNIVDVSGSVNVNTISGYALESGGNLATVATNTNKFVFTGNDLNTIVSNFPNQQNVLVDNQISGYALETGGNLATVATNTNKLKSDTTYTNAIQVAVKNTVDVSGSVNVNTISGYALESGGNLATVATNTNKLKSDTTYTDAIQVAIKNTTLDVSGSVNVNTISGYALESGGNLATVATNTNKLKTDTTYTDAIQVAVKNASLTVNTISGFALESGGNLATVATNSNKFKFTGDNLKTQVATSGTDPLIVSELSPLTNYAMEDGGNLASIKTNTDKNTYDPSGNLKVNLATGSISVSSVNIKDSSGNNIYADASGNVKTNIQNSSLDVHCYASSNGTNWHHLKSDANGILNIHSMTQDGAGTDISSTLNSGKQSLDVNLTNNNSIKVDISGVGLNGNKLNCDVSGQHIALDAQLFTLNTGYAPHVLTCSYTDFYDQQYSLDTASAICTTGFDINGGLRRRELTGKDIVYKTSTSPDNRYALDTTSHIATKGANLTTDPTYMTSTTVNSKNGLDVNVINDTVKVDISGSTVLEGKIAVFDALSFPYIERISVGAGADINAFTFGNFYNNITINAGAYSTPGNFAAGSYGRRAMLFYRDGATSSTDSISFYTNSNFGISTPLFMATTYPIVNGGYRWSTIILNILPFSSLYIRNDSTTINNTGVYLTMIGV
jgi:hypothetical protein